MSFEKKMEKTIAALKKAADQESRTNDLFEQFSDSGVAACNLAIDAGEMLLDLKETAKKEGKKWGDVCANLPIGQKQISRYTRLSAHKVTARALVNDNRVFNLEEVVKQLPKVNEPPALESKADPKNLAYTGKQPPSNGDAPRDSDDWHTPMKYIELAREVMGVSILTRSHPSRQTRGSARHPY